MISLVNQLFFTEQKNAINNFIDKIFKEYNYCKNLMKKNFNKNLVMSAEDEERFQSSNKCWMWDRLFDWWIIK